MKFSLFGFTTGSAYDLKNLDVINATHLGFRVRYAVANSPGVTVSLNGGAKTLANIADTDVTDIKIDVPELGEITVRVHSRNPSMHVSASECPLHSEP